MIACFFGAFFLFSAWRMILTMLIVSVYASIACFVFPFLAPIAFGIMVILFFARIGYVLKNWRAVVAGLLVYGLAHVLLYEMQKVYSVKFYIYEALVKIIPASVISMTDNPSL